MLFDVSSMRPRLAAFLVLAVLLPSFALAADPLKTVRAFCAADGRGERIDPRTWPALAPFIAWRLEPAWDRIRLVKGYQVGTPILARDEVMVPVDYTVLAEVGPGTVEKRPFVERHVYRLARDESDDRWRVLPPPPMPYVFDSQADADALADLLDGEGGQYLSASELVHRLVIGAGWLLPPSVTPTLASSPYLEPVESPRAGDLVFYFDGDTAYHVGLLESQTEAVSATLNAGIRRAPVDAFAGRVEYRRLLTQPRPAATAAPATPSPAATRTEDE